MNNLEFVDRHSIENDGFAPSGGHIGKVSKDDTEKWLEKIKKDPILWKSHLHREAELTKRKAEQFLY